VDLRQVTRTNERSLGRRDRRHERPFTVCSQRRHSRDDTRGDGDASPTSAQSADDPLRRVQLNVLPVGEGRNRRSRASRIRTVARLKESSRTRSVRAACLRSCPDRPSFDSEDLSDRHPDTCRSQSDSNPMPLALSGRRWRRRVAPEGQSRLAGRNRRPSSTQTNRLSRSRGAAECASPESTVWTHGLGERSALSGVRRAPEGQSRLAGRNRRPRTREGLDLFGRFNQARGDNRQRSQ
jgi:hypothetical protein